MDSEKFITKCKELVRDYHNDNDLRKVTKEEVYVVWQVKVLQNSKALLSTPIPDGMYYEVTYNGDKNEIYFDAYKKSQNIKVEV